MTGNLNRLVSLSPKDLRFLMALIDERLAQFEGRLQASDLSEDDASDILNDKFFLEGLRATLERASANMPPTEST